MCSFPLRCTSHADGKCYEGRESDAQDPSFFVHVLSIDSGKAAIANAATLLARQFQSAPHNSASEFSVAQNDLNAILEGSFLHLFTKIAY